MNKETLALFSTAEHDELKQLSGRIEQFDAQRLAVLVELAQLRGIDLDVLMAQLGLGNTGWAN